MMRRLGLELPASLPDLKSNTTTRAPKPTPRSIRWDLSGAITVQAASVTPISFYRAGS
jgi:hypothetical protein